MNNNEAIYILKNELMFLQDTFSDAVYAKALEVAIGALENINRIQEIMAMPIQENVVKYLAICEVMNK